MSLSTIIDAESSTPYKCGEWQKCALHKPNCLSPANYLTPTTTTLLLLHKIYGPSILLGTVQDFKTVPITYWYFKSVVMEC